MDKYNNKIAFNKWFSAINFEECSKEAQNTIKNFDHYYKKLNFETTLKTLLHAVYEELPSHPEITRAFRVSTLRPISKTSSLQLIDSITIPLNKIWFPWAKFH